MRTNQFALYSLYRWSQFIVSLIGSVVLSRRLGPEGFVLSGVVLALQAILTVVVEFGYLDFSLVNKSKYSSIIERSYNTMAVWAAFVSVISLLVAWMFNFFEIGLWAAMFVCLLPFKSIITIKLVINGDHNSYAKKLLLSSIFSYLIILFFVNRITVEYVVIIRALLDGLLFILSSVFLLERFSNKHLNRREVSEMSNSMSVNLATTVLRAYDRILFSRMLEPTTYAYAERVTNYSNVVVLNTLHIYTNIVLERGSKTIKEFGLTISIFLVVTLGIFLYFSDDILFTLFLWIHGDKWAESSDVFKIMIHVTPPTMGVVLVGWKYKLKNLFHNYSKELWISVLIHLGCWLIYIHYLEINVLKYYVFVLYLTYTSILSRAFVFRL